MKITLDASKPGKLIIKGKRFRAKVFQVAGQEIELYPLQALAFAVGRSSMTIRDWEKAKLIPKPLFKIAGKPREELIRWYSRTQVINLYQAYQRFPCPPGGVDRKNLREPFFALVNLVFDEGEIIDVGNIAVKHGTTAHTRTAAHGGSVSIGDSHRTDAGAGVRKTITTHTRPDTAERADRPATTSPLAPSHPAPVDTESRTGGPVVASNRGQASGSRELLKQRRFQLQSVGQSNPSDQRHITGSTPVPERQGPNYRRRPKSRV